MAQQRAFLTVWKPNPVGMGVINRGIHNDPNGAWWVVMRRIQGSTGNPGHNLSASRNNQNKWGGKIRHGAEEVRAEEFGLRNSGSGLGAQGLGFGAEELGLRILT